MQAATLGPEQGGDLTMKRLTGASGSHAGLAKVDPLICRCCLLLQDQRRRMI